MISHPAGNMVVESDSCDQNVFDEGRRECDDAPGRGGPTMGSKVGSDEEFVRACGLLLPGMRRVASGGRALWLAPNLYGKCVIKALMANTTT